MDNTQMDNTHVNGVTLIALERARQQREEGYTREKDAHNPDGVLSLAAIAYAAPANEQLYLHRLTKRGVAFTDPFPWDPLYDKRGKHNRLRRLQIAGALIAAEMDLLLFRGETL